MTGHRAARRAGVVAVLAAGLLALLPAPVLAQPDGPDLRLGGINSIELKVGGGPQNVQLRIENRAQDPITGTAENVQLTMTVPLTEFGVYIASAPSDCNRTNDNTRMDCQIDEIPAGETWTGVAQVGVHGNSPLQAGETRNGTAQVVLSGGGQQQFNVRLEGPEQAPAVPEVSGFVTNEATGERIEGATVLLVDSQNAEYRTTTDANGEFRFAGENIAPGSIGLQPSMEGFEGQQNIQQGVAGEPLTGIQLTLRSTATPTPTATPSATPTATPSGTPSPVAAADTGGSGSGFFTTFLIIMGLLFVLLGVGAIVFLIIRRRREQREEGPGGPGAPVSGPGGPGPRPRPGSHGVYRPGPAPATQVMGGGQTQVMGGRGSLPAVGPSPALADAPTMMQQRAGGADQTTMLPRAGDPAGPPGQPPASASPHPPPRPGPAGPRPPVAGSPPPPRPAAPTYGSPDAPTYGGPDAPTYGGPAAPTYGSLAGSAGYQPPPAGYQPGSGYQSSSGYQPPADRAGPGSGGYARGGAPRESGYGGSYGPDPYTRPAPPQPAPSPPAAGYRPSGGDGNSESGYYQQPYPGGAEHSGAHHRPPAPSGYDQPAYGGYDQSGYRGGDYDDEAGQPRGRHAEPPERRRLDWLDDT